MNKPTSQDRWPHLSATVGLIAALTLVACAPAATPTTLTTAPPATTTSSAPATTASQATDNAAMETATAFLETYRVSFDIDEAFSYLAADVEGLGSVAEERLFARFLQAIGSKTILGPCEELSTGSNGTEVRCSFEDHMLRSDEIGLGPYGGSAFVLTVLDGQVTSYRTTFPPNAFSDPNGFSEQIWEPFADWVAETHPEDIAIMYDPYPTGWRITEESIPLWEQRTRDYVEVARVASIEIATLFLEAYAARDAEGAASYLAPAALASFGGSVETLRLDLQHNEAQGFKLLLDPCEELSTSSSGTTVRCPYDYHGIRSDEMGLGPYGDNHYDLTIVDGKIVSMRNHIAFMTNGFSREVWEPFADWIADTYPEDGAIMYQDWPNMFMQQVTEEANELWEQRSIEYVATRP